MKKGILLSASILAIVFSSFAQNINMGTIEVNENFSATLLFPDSIQLIVFGNNPIVNDDFVYYDNIKDGKLCIIRGNTDKAPETSITVIIKGQRVFYGNIKYGFNSKILYSFETEETKPETDNKFSPKTNKENSRLASLMADKPEYFVFGARESGVEFLISNIKNDETNSYIKIIIDNKTGGDFLIDGILFKYIEGKRRGANKKEAQIEERIMPKLINGPEVASAYTKIEVGIIIPIFAIGDSGKFIIQIREKNGTRNPQISISGKDMLKVKVF